MAQNKEQKLKEFEDKLRELGIGDFKIKIKYDQGRTNPAYQVGPHQYMDRNGYVRTHNSRPVSYFELYDNNTGRCITHFLDSSDLIRWMFNLHRIQDVEKAKYLTECFYFNTSKFSF